MGPKSAIASLRRSRRAVPSESLPAPCILARLRHVRQRIDHLRRRVSDQPRGEYDFLLGRVIDAPTLQRAENLADQWGVLPHEVMISLGWVDERAYVASLAADLQVDWLGRTPGREVQAVERLFGAYAYRPSVVRAALGNLPAGVRPVLATRREMDVCHLAQAGAALIDHAIDGLWQANPLASAKTGPESWQVLVVVALVGFLVGGVAVLPDVVLPFVMALLTLPFLCVVLLRFAAVAELLRARPAEPTAPRQADAELPRYSVLVPLYREGDILPDLVRALSALDYPSAKLEILLVLEASDRETAEVLARLELPGNIRPVVVPDKGPRTKPKALNYALELVRSTYVVVYDAEDIPEPGQLRAALDAFAQGGAEVACVQARLGIHNTAQGWLPRQFALEYAALFDGQLPSLHRLGLPLPLGGTSNHFRVDRLREVGGWDPFNVTEDADLGLRLARAGYRTLTIPSTTWEEAPITLASWIPQRTRWLKGWMQTYLVHTRWRARSRQVLGWWAWSGLHIMMCGMLLSALVHPIVLAIVGWQIMAGELLPASAHTLERALIGAGLANLALGYVSAMLAAALAAWKRGWYGLCLQAALMPFYWLLVSFASYRALLQLIRAPHLWEKTAHGHSRSSTKARTGGAAQS